MHLSKICRFCIVGAFVISLVHAQSQPVRLSGLMDGNQVRTLIYNYGSIGRPNTEPSFEWPAGSSQGYGFEFGLIIGTRVTGDDGTAIHFIEDGLVVGGVSGNNPFGTPNDWQPVTGYAANTENGSIARSDDPGTWPADWTSWPGLTGDGVILGNLESYYVLNDRYVARHWGEYHALAGDTTYSGAGIQVAVRGYQWDIPELEDVLLLVYEVTNISEYFMDSVVVGMKGDPHIGGPNDYADDEISCFLEGGIEVQTGELQPAIQNLIYAWDHNNTSGPEFNGRPAGYLGIHLVDLNQGDRITSLQIPMYTSISYSEMTWWNQLTSPIITSQFEENADNIVIFGTNFFALQSGETKRVPIAFIFGETKSDLIQNTANVDNAYRDIFMPEVSPPVVQINTPILDQIVTNIVTVNYSLSAGSEPIEHAELFYTRNDSTGWHDVDSLDMSQSSYAWSTANLPDGYNYQLGIRVFAGNTWRFVKSPYFILNNSAPAEPDLLPLFPLYERELDSTVTIRWRAGDPDGDITTTIIELSEDDGLTWQPISVSMGEDSYEWNTRLFSNSDFCKLRWTVVQGGNSYTAETIRFSINNQFPTLPDTLITHSTGLATGQMIVNIVDPTGITGDEYRVTFDGTIDSTMYSVKDLNSNQTLIDHEQLPLTPYMGNLFHGIRLSFDNPELSLDQDNSGWNAGNTNLNYSLGTTPNSLIEPCDYNVIFYNTPIDTPWNKDYPINCLVKNATTGVLDSIFLIDASPQDGFIGPRDFIGMLFLDAEQNLHGSWSLHFYAPADGDTILPVLGDTLMVRTIKPFTSLDTLQFDTGNYVSIHHGNVSSIPDQYQLFQNYPNPFNPTTTIRYTLPENGQVNLTIYDQLGRQVKTLVNQSQTAGEYQVQWDGRDDNGRLMSSGLYFLTIKSGSFKQTEKLVLLK